MSIVGQPTAAGGTATTTFSSPINWGGSLITSDFGHTLNFAGFSFNIDTNWIAQIQQSIEDSSSQTEAAQTPTNSGGAIQLSGGGSFTSGGSALTTKAVNKV